MTGARAHQRAVRPGYLRRLGATWEGLARENPMWAVLSSRRDWDEDEFFARGAEESDRMMAYLESLDRPDGRDLALDFGCGLGRVTRPLAGHFKRVIGVDIAPSMIAGARRLNGSCTNCEFLLNTAPDLRRFESGSFDLVYSMMTLQHMRPELTKGYLAEFLRVVSDSGLIVFQLPARPTAGPVKRMRRAARNLGRSRLRVPKLIVRRLRHQAMEMHPIPKQDVLRFLDSAGGRAIDVQPSGSAGQLFESYRYAVVRAGR